MLYRGDSLAHISTPTALALGNDGINELAESVPVQGATGFYRIRRVPRASPLDLDGDGIDDVYELSRPGLLSPLNGADANLDPNGNGKTHLQEYLIATTPLTRLREVSPKAGEGDVAVTRETVFRLTQALAESTVLDGSRVYAQFGGRRLLARVELSTDRKTVTLFYLENLPGSARVRATFVGNGLTDFLGRALDLDGDGAPGGVATVDFDTLSITPVPGTAVIGRVFASEKIAGQNNTNFVNHPLAGVTITVDGMEEKLRTTTDVNGFFRLEPAPAGRFFVLVDGRTAQPVPLGAHYAFVGKAWETVAGRTNNLAAGTGEIFLPLISAGTLQPVSLSDNTPITFPAAILASNPGLAGVTITVPANSLFSNDGSRGGKVGIAPVAPDRLPEPLPPGLNFPLVITVQTDGPSNFDRPVSVRFPNLPDPITGEKLPAGAKSALWSFNHDKGHWEIVGPMTVTADGQFVETDLGVGIQQPGWAATLPGTQVQGSPPVKDPSDPPPLEYGPPDPLPPLPPDINPNPNIPPVPPPQPCPKLSAWQKAEAIYNITKEIADCAASLAGVKEGLQCLLNAIKAAAEIDFAMKKLHDDLSAKPPVAKGQALLSTFSFLKKDKELAVVAEECFEKASPIGTAEKIVTCIGSALGIANTICGTLQPDPTAPASCQPSKLTQKVCKGLDVAKTLQTQVSDLIKVINAAKDKLALKFICAQLGNLEIVIKATVNQPPPKPLGLQSVPDDSLTPEQVAQILAAVDGTLGELAPYLQAGASIGDTRAALENLETNLNSLLDQATAALRETGETLPTRLFYAITINGNIIRGVTSAQGTIDTRLAPDSDYVLEMYDPVGNSYGTSSGHTAANGQITQLRVVKLASASTLSDTDKDSLADSVEFVIGTDPSKPDTDGDGINDGVEIRQGLNPLDGLPTTTGIVGSGPTPGPALDVCTGNDLAIVACAQAGVVVFNIKNSSSPVRIAQVATPGNARRVACSGNFVAVVEEIEGLSVIDISDPPAARITQQIKFSVAAQAVATVNGVAYVGLASGDIVAVDLNTGAILDKISALNTSVQDLGIDGDYLYVGSGQGVDVLTLTPLNFVAHLTARVGVESRLFVGDGLAYAVHDVGFSTLNISDPAKPLLQSSSAPLVLSSFYQMVPTGSGLGLAIVSQGLFLYDLSDPANSDLFLAQITALSAARAVSVYNGLAYVADATGLQVVNFRAIDTAGKPPTISLAANFPLAPAQIEEGKLARALVRVTDDVQVRNVEFYLDGVKVLTDGSFPFEYRFITPLVAAGRNSFQLRAKAIDTGGNEAWSDDIQVTLVKDVTPPQIVSHIPADVDVVAVAANVAAFFSEPINAAAISSLTFQLREAGPDGAFDTADDVTLSPVGFEYRPVTFGAYMKFADILPVGNYRATVGPAIWDLAGNKLAAPVNWSFKVKGAITKAVTAPKLAAGSAFTMVLKTDGSLWAWGNNSLGQLGETVTGSDPFATRNPIQVNKDTDWFAIVAGSAHSIALKTDGSLWAWGSNSEGQLGDGTQATSKEPKRIGPDNDWKSVGAGNFHTLAIKNDGSLWAWGYNGQGRLGDGTSQSRLAPVRIGTDTDWAAAVAGADFTLAIKKDGTLWAWGSNSYGQLGGGTQRSQAAPIRIGPDSDWLEIAAPSAGRFSLAIKSDASLWGWGDNSTGQLGDGTITQRKQPTRIGTDNNWSSIRAGTGTGFIFVDSFPIPVEENFALASKLDGSVWAWGANHTGQLGDGTNQERHAPGRVGTANDWKAIVAGSDHSIALRADGSLWGWGGNGAGQLGIFRQQGINSVADQSNPIQIGTANDWGTAP
ncbi:MAG: Ig-like domain-containing protein [Verrucomicrobia bacterium]|nr:Ig-like domain-containing protein [Verrucomicrobiota bacterium]